MCGWDWGRSLREGVQSPRLEEWRSLCSAEAGTGADQRGGDAAVHYPRGGSFEAPGDVRTPQRGQVRKWDHCPDQWGPGFSMWIGEWEFGGIKGMDSILGLWLKWALNSVHEVWFEVSTGHGAACQTSPHPCALPPTHTNSHLQRHRCVI